MELNHQQVDGDDKQIRLAKKVEIIYRKSNISDLVVQMEARLGWKGA